MTVSNFPHNIIYSITHSLLLLNFYTMSIKRTYGSSQLCNNMQYVKYELGYVIFSKNTFECSTKTWSSITTLEKPTISVKLVMETFR